MDDMGVLRPLLTVLVADCDAQGLEVAGAAQFREVPVEELGANDGAVVV